MRILFSDIVLTAAHCVLPGAPYKIIVTVESA
jgi:hypothetical protein